MRRNDVMTVRGLEIKVPTCKSLSAGKVDERKDPQLPCN